MKHRVGLRRLSTAAARWQVAAKRAAVEFVEDRGHRDAAQLAFFALLSFVPVAMLLVAGFGLVFEDADVRRRIIRTAFDAIPLAGEGDRPRLERSVDDALDNAGGLGPVSIVVLVVAATGVMGALRHAINEAWDIDERPPLLARKALDAAMILVATTLLLTSLALSATRRASLLLSDEGDVGWLLALALDLVGEVLPFVMTAGVVLLLYRVLPMRRPSIRAIWPGAVVAAALLFGVKAVLELYFEHLADLGALYGSLGALMALLLFVFAASNALVYGAEFASEHAGLPADEAVREEAAGDRRRVLALARRRRG
jgi:membrane protein